MNTYCARCTHWSWTCVALALALTGLAVTNTYHVYELKKIDRALLDCKTKYSNTACAVNSVGICHDYSQDIKSFTFQEKK